MEKNFENFQSLTLEKVFGQDMMQKWNKKYEVLTSEQVQKWIEAKMKKFANKGKDASKFKPTGYLNAMNQYAKFSNLTPDEMLKEDIDTRNSRLMHYLNYLIKEKGRNPVSVVNGYQSKIKSFFSQRGFPISAQIPCFDSGLNKNEIFLEREMIQTIEHAFNSPQYRLLIKTQAQLGLRIEDCLEELCSGNYEIEEYKGYYFIRNFMTQKEKVVINFLFFPTELSNLFKSAMNCQDLTQLDLTGLFKSRISDNRISQSNYLTRMKELVAKLGYKGNVKTHSFRKWFITQVTGSDEKLEFREHLAGHKQQKLSNAYVRTLSNIETFFQSWLNIEPQICIDAEVIDKTDDKIIALEQELAEEKTLREQMKKEYSKEILELKNMLVKMNDIITGLKEDRQ